MDYSKRREPFRNITGYINTEFNNCDRMQNLKDSYCSGKRLNNFDKKQSNKRPAYELCKNMNTTKRMQPVISNHKITHFNCKVNPNLQLQNILINCSNQYTYSDDSENFHHCNNTKNYTAVVQLYSSSSGSTFCDSYNVNKLNNATQNTRTNQILPLKDINSKILANKMKSYYDEIDSSDDDTFYNESNLNPHGYRKVTFGISEKPKINSNVSPNITSSQKDYDTHNGSDLKTDLLTSQFLKETFEIIADDKSRYKIQDKNNENYNQTLHTNKSSTNELENYSKLVNTNMTYSNVLYPNISPTEKMKQRMDDALEAILYIINETVRKNLRRKINCSDRKLFYRSLKSIVRKRIETALMGKPVRSRSDIIDTYLQTYPKEDTQIIALYGDCINYPFGSFVPDLIETDDPKLYYKLNMMRLINTKLKKIITVIENMYKHSNQQLLALPNKPIQKYDKGDKGMKYRIQKCIFYDKLIINTIESQFSKSLKKLKNEIVANILIRESSD